MCWQCEVHISGIQIIKFALFRIIRKVKCVKPDKYIKMLLNTLMLLNG